jgi:hypothetical protein
MFDEAFKHFGAAAPYMLLPESQRREATAGGAALRERERKQSEEYTRFGQSF